MVPNWVVYLFMFILVIISVVIAYTTGKRWEKEGVNKKNDKPD